MSVRGAVLLGEVAGQLTVLEVACKRCDRRGRLSAARLVAQHGADMPLPDLLRLLSADCPKRVAGLVHDPCGAFFPGLEEGQDVAGSAAAATRLTVLRPVRRTGLA